MGACGVWNDEGRPCTNNSVYECTAHHGTWFLCEEHAREVRDEHGFDVPDLDAMEAEKADAALEEPKR